MFSASSLIELATNPFFLKRAAAFLVMASFFVPFLDALILAIGLFVQN
jgi:hypothetical protein